MQVYGLKTCDTCRSARKFLRERQIDFTFHDVRAQPVPRATLERAAAELDWQDLVNRRGTTWRQLPQEERETGSAAAVLDLIERHPAVMKRPLFVTVHRVMVGFDERTRAYLSERTDSGN